MGYIFITIHGLIFITLNILFVVKRKIELTPQKEENKDKEDNKVKKDKDKKDNKFIKGLNPIIASLCSFIAYVIILFIELIFNEPYRDLYPFDFLVLIEHFVCFIVCYTLSFVALTLIFHPKKEIPDEIDEVDNELYKQIKEFYNTTDYSKRAFLIDGEWGTGKSYFVKKAKERIEYDIYNNTSSDTIDDSNEVKKKNKVKVSYNKTIAYISLNGLNSIEEVEKEIYNNIFPIVNELEEILIGLKFFNKILSDKYSLDVLTTPESYLKRFLNKSSVKMIVIDDLERSTIDFQILLGFISKLSEVKKVLVIGYIDKIKDREIYKYKDKNTFKIVCLSEILEKTFYWDIIPFKFSTDKVIKILEDHEKLFKVLGDKERFFINFIKDKNLRNLRLISDACDKAEDIVTKYSLYIDVLWQFLLLTIIKFYNNFLDSKEKITINNGQYCIDLKDSNIFDLFNAFNTLCLVGKLNEFTSLSDDLDKIIYNFKVDLFLKPIDFNEYNGRNLFRVYDYIELAEIMLVCEKDKFDNFSNNLKMYYDYYNYDMNKESNQVFLLSDKKYFENLKLYVNKFKKSETEQTRAKEIEDIINGSWNDIQKIYEEGNEIKFGKYPQGENGEIQPIEWIVLENDGTSALLISKYALDCKQFHNTREGTAWEKCNLRNWLNTTFINTAFTNEEQDQIKLSEVTADINPKWNTTQGNNTKDEIFLLSIKEVDKYFNDDEERATKGTLYFYKKGALVNLSNNNCYWWLRSSGKYADTATYVDSDGSVNSDGHYFGSTNYAVRPALRINL